MSESGSICSWGLCVGIVLNLLGVVGFGGGMNRIPVWGIVLILVFDLKSCLKCVGLGVGTSEMSDPSLEL